VFDVVKLVDLFHHRYSALSLLTLFPEIVIEAKGLGVLMVQFLNDSKLHIALIIVIAAGEVALERT
jgi:hypothetical protein